MAPRRYGSRRGAAQEPEEEVEAEVEMNEVEKSEDSVSFLTFIVLH